MVEDASWQSSGDELHLVKKAPLDSHVESDTELAHYARAAKIAVTGEPD